MTEYHTGRQRDSVTDIAATNGIVNDEFLEGVEPEWVTGINPKILRDVADLVEFCYGHDRHGSLDVGLVDSQRDAENRPPAILIGDADDDRYIMAAPRLDCRAGPKDHEQDTLGESKDE